MSFSDFLKKPIVEGIKNKIGNAAIIGLGLGTLAAGFKGIEYVRRKLIQDPKRLQILDELVREDPVLKDADPEKLLEYYSVIFHTAPSITLNKGALREPLRNFIRFDKVDLATLRTLTEIEEKRSRTLSAPSFLDDLMNTAKVTSSLSSVGDILAKTSSDNTPILKEASASIYRHAKNKERYYKGIASINYFKDKGIF